MKKLRISVVALGMAAWLLTACSNISDDERLTYVKPAEVGRCVLIEDFTGQKCVNCPKATEEIEQLQQQYGADTVIAVGIHSGYFGVYPSAGVNGLATETGNEYYNHWGVESQPSGVIDRSDGVLTYDIWAAKTSYDLQQKAPLSIQLENTLIGKDSVSIHVETIGTTGEISGKLQLWAIEDSIVAFQMLPDGSTDSTYVQNHVFRAAINGSWGDDFSISEGEVKDLTYHYRLDPAWNPSHVSIVAFVYNLDDGGVKQVTKKSIE